MKRKPITDLRLALFLLSDEKSYTESCLYASAMEIEVLCHGNRDVTTAWWPVAAPLIKQLIPLTQGTPKWGYTDENQRFLSLQNRPYARKLYAELVEDLCGQIEYDLGLVLSDAEIIILPWQNLFPPHLSFKDRSVLID